MLGKLIGSPPEPLLESFCLLSCIVRMHSVLAQSVVQNAPPRSASTNSGVKAKNSLYLGSFWLSPWTETKSVLRIDKTLTPDIAYTLPRRQFSSRSSPGRGETPFLPNNHTLQRCCILASAQKHCCHVCGVLGGLDNLSQRNRRLRFDSWARML